MLKNDSREFHHLFTPGFFDRCIRTLMIKRSDDAGSPGGARRAAVTTRRPSCFPCPCAWRASRVRGVFRTSVRAVRAPSPSFLETRRANDASMHSAGAVADQARGASAREACSADDVQDKSESPFSRSACG